MLALLLLFLIYRKQLELRGAIVEAADCLEEAIANRIAMELAIPHPSPIMKRHHPILLSVQMAAKAALYLAIGEERKIGTAVPIKSSKFQIVNLDNNRGLPILSLENN
ncbi:MAG: hypothetical protein ACE5KZ_09150 [Candidatus Scalinduaceae bacterium]